MQSGFFDLITPEDLFKKLKKEYEQFMQRPYDACAAYNFFVTAEHLPDWLHSKGIKNQILPRICSELANGAKHFGLKPFKHPNPVINKTYKNRCLEEGIVEEGILADPLIVALEKKASDALGVDCIEATDLASKILSFWEGHFANRVKGNGSNYL